MAGTNITPSATPTTGQPTTGNAPPAAQTDVPTLAGFLGLPAAIDWQDLLIRAGLVLVGIILLILVAWSFVQPKQTVQVQVPPPEEVPPVE